MLKNMSQIEGRRKKMIFFFFPPMIKMICNLYIMKQLFKRILLILSIFFVAVLVLAAIAASLFEDQIGQEVISQINKQLKTELKVEKVDISVLSTFPQAGVNLRGVLLEGTQGRGLLEAEKIVCRFGLFSLFGSNVKINSIEIEDGAMNVVLDRNGNPNYDIFKETESTTTEESSETSGGLSLETARLEDIELIYADEQNKQNVAIQVQEALFSGDFSGEQFSLQSTAEMTTRFVDMGQTRYLAGKNITYDAKVLMDLGENIYDLEAVEVSLGDNVFNLEGIIKLADTYTDYDLAIDSDESSLEAIFQLMPREYQSYVKDFSSSGTFLFDATVKGKMDAVNQPAINVKFNLEDGSLSSPKLEDSFKDVSFTANFTNGKARSNKTSILDISNLKGYFSRELIELQLQVMNLDDPTIDFKLNGTLPLSSVYGALGSESITDGDGEIEIRDLVLKGRYKDMITPSRISKVQASGQMEFDDAELTINKETLIVDRGDLILEGNELTIDGVKIEGAGSEIIFNGNAQNLLPVVFADSLNSKQAILNFRAKMEAEDLDLDRLMALTDVSVEEDEVQQAVYDSLKVKNTEQREFYTSFLNGTFDAVVDAFNYNKIEGEEFNGKVAFENNDISIKGRTEAMGGTFDLEGDMFVKETPYLEVKLTCDQINAQTFFEQAENFGQDVLTSKHVDGTLHAKMLIKAFWDKEANFLMDKLHVLAAIGIEKGELKDFEMLESFSTYVKIRDLEHIKFDNAENWLEIKNSKIHIPVMFIQSNAMNMTLSGDYTFDHDLDYNIKINAGQILANRFKKYNPEMRPQKAQRDGWFNVYTKIYGNIDNFQYRMARKEVKMDFEVSKHKKLAIRNALLKKFTSIDLIEEPAEWEDIPEFDEGDDDVEYLDGY